MGMGIALAALDRTTQCHALLSKPQHAADSERLFKTDWEKFKQYQNKHWKKFYYPVPYPSADHTESTSFQLR